jgi:hypothetical protein
MVRSRSAAVFLRAGEDDQTAGNMTAELFVRTAGEGDPQPDTVRGQASALNSLGRLTSAGDPGSGRRNHTLALRLAPTIANPQQEARAWEGIGRALVAAGDVHGGVRRLRRALDIYRRLGHYEWRDVHAFVGRLEGRS